MNSVVADIIQEQKNIVFKRPVVLRPKDPQRREAAKYDLLQFGRSYFPLLDWDSGLFIAEFCQNLSEPIRVKGNFSYMKALAAPRACGKTTASLIFILWCLMYRHVKFAAIFSATRPDAAARQATVQNFMFTSELLLQDFPELCGPVREIGNDPRVARLRGGYWSDSFLTLANGAMLMSSGLECSVRGIVQYSTRPELILLDDVESEDSVYSLAESSKLERRMSKEVMGLAGKNSKSIYLFLSTIIKKNCMADRLTDPVREPEWRGKRWSALITPPIRADLWDRYMAISGGAECIDVVNLDEISVILSISKPILGQFVPSHLSALAFYVHNKLAMDEGALVLDPVRRPLHDLYYERQVKGNLFWLCELQQTPPNEEVNESRGLLLEHLRGRANDTDPNIVPEECEYLTASIDVGLRKLHWEINAWDDSFSACNMIACGMEDIGSAYDLAEDKKGRALSGIKLAMERIRAKFSSDFVREDGVVQKIKIIMCDAGGAVNMGDSSFSWAMTIVKLCREFGPQWRAIRGHKWSSKLAQKAGGRHFIRSEMGFLLCEADYYKNQLYDSWTAPVIENIRHKQVYKGCPLEFLRHQTAEMLVSKNGQLRWVLRSEREGGYNRNHWFDCSWMNFAAADLLSVSLSMKKHPVGVVGKAFS